MNKVPARLLVRLIREEVEAYQHTSPRVSKAADVVEICADLLEEPQEHMVVLCLDSKNKVIGRHDVTVGSNCECMVPPADVFRAALLCNARSIIMVHNHPSGDPQPSIADDRCTQRIKELGDIMGIDLRDHVIIGTAHHFYSYNTFCKL